MVWKVPPIKYERVIVHSWAGDDPNFVIAYVYDGKPVGTVDQPLEEGDDQYGRGMMFFKWLEARKGRDGIRKLYRETIALGEDWKSGLEELTGLKWEKILEVEQAWSEAYGKRMKPKE